MAPSRPVVDAIVGLCLNEPLPTVPPVAGNKASPPVLAGAEASPPLFDVPPVAGAKGPEAPPVVDVPPVADTFSDLGGNNSLMAVLELPTHSGMI